MDRITGEIRQALGSQLYYPAIAITLSLPDICAALESSNGETNGDKYKAWCERWFIHTYPQLRSRDLYKMRCGVLHQGRMGHRGMHYSRVLFTLPDAANNVLHDNVIDDALNLDAVTFCQDMVQAVLRWYDASKNDPNVVSNLPRLFQYHENGLAPYIVGIPLIA